MAFKLEFETDNAAFDGDLQEETATVLRRVAERIERGDLRGKAMDTNGNSIGTFVLTP